MYKLFDQLIGVTGAPAIAIVAALALSVELEFKTFGDKAFRKSSLQPKDYAHTIQRKSEYGTKSNTYLKDSTTSNRADRQQST